MTAADALMIAGVFGVPADLEHARKATWIATVWYYGLDPAVTPEHHWNEWWSVRCMLGMMNDVVPFSVGGGAGRFCGLKKHAKYRPAESEIKDDLRRLYLARWSANMRLKPPGMYGFPPGAEPWALTPKLPTDLVAKARSE